MPKITVGLGVILFLLGIVGYILVDGASKTALIPSFFGVVFIILGGLAVANLNLRKHLMHGAAGLALLGLLGTIKALPQGIYLISVGPVHVDNPIAVAAQSIMALLCGGFLYLCVQSFRAARRKQNAEAKASSL
jgi:hypothetical protein